MKLRTRTNSEINRNTPQGPHSAVHVYQDIYVYGNLFSKVIIVGAQTVYFLVGCSSLKENFLISCPALFLNSFLEVPLVGLFCTTLECLVRRLETSGSYQLFRILNTSTTSPLNLLQTKVCRPRCCNLCLQLMVLTCMPVFRLPSLQQWYELLDLRQCSTEQ